MAKRRRIQTMAFSNYLYNLESIHNMNLAEIERYQKIIASAKPSNLSSWIEELKNRGSGLNTHYNGDLAQLPFSSGNQLPDIGMMGTASAFSLFIGIENYQFQSEYSALAGELTSLGYTEKLKTGESIEPSAISNLMTMAFERRKALEDRTMQLLGSVNTVLKSIISITYELKELDRNLSFYKLAESKEPEKSAAAELALKRIFVDNVDARKGGASLTALSSASSRGQGGAAFIDLVSVFYSVKNLHDVNALQRNEQYKNIIKNRFIEYEEWKKINKTDLNNRRDMLLQYLKSQVAAYKMYRDWAAESLTILKRINMVGVKDAASYVKSKRPDIFESSQFSVGFIAANPLYVRDYDVEYKKVFGQKGPELPTKAVPKTNGPPVTQGPREESRSFLYNRLKKYGPKVIAAIEVNFGFTESQFFPKGVPQERPQYQGGLSINIRPYCFTLDEWYLLKKAIEEKISKTVFEGVDQVSVSSLQSIQKDLDAYIAEAEKKEEKEKVKSAPQFALLDIYQSFKDDIMGINKSLSFSGGSGNKGEFKPDHYEIAVSHKLFSKSRMKDAVAIGLLVSNSDAELAYEVFKDRKKLLSPISKFDNPLF